MSVEFADDTGQAIVTCLEGECWLSGGGPTLHFAPRNIIVRSQPQPRRKMFLVTAGKIAANVYDRTSRPLANMPIEAAARYARFHGQAHALVITGESVDDSLDRIRRVKPAVKHTPVYGGGGTTKDNIAQFFAACDGVIVGNAVKTGPEFQGQG
jgi:predicted TIM-barrel enzyme